MSVSTQSWPLTLSQPSSWTISECASVRNTASENGHWRRKPRLSYTLTRCFPSLVVNLAGEHSWVGDLLVVRLVLPSTFLTPMSNSSSNSIPLRFSLRTHTNFSRPVIPSSDARIAGQSPRNRHHPTLRPETRANSVAHPGPRGAVFALCPQLSEVRPWFYQGLCSF